MGGYPSLPMRELASYLFLTSLLCTSIATPLAIRLGNRWGILDDPGHRKIHLDPIPLVGGWAIFLTLTIVIWGHLLGALLVRGTDLDILLGERLEYYVSLAPKLMIKIAPVYTGAAIIFILGLIDDV